MTFEPADRRAQIVGTGLIGGSVGSALRRRGWTVTGYDTNPQRAARAVQLGVIERSGRDPEAAIVFVATPAGSVAGAVEEALAAHPRAVVTDVAGVKGPVVGRVTDPRFVGGHPMAGSEQEGVDGSDPEMFEGATWVLTPEPHTDPVAFASVRSVVSQMGANVVELAAGLHDDMVALVSHVPHLTAATLMNLAADTALEHATLLRLAAGGFRDMTRIAAGEATIWPDVCAENRDGILEVLDRLLSALTEVRTMVAAGDRPQLLRSLERAREARVNLPAGVPSADAAVEVRVPVADRPGILAGVTTLLGEMGVNIYDLEIAHSAEGDRGVLVLVIDAANSEAVRAALHEREYRCSIRPLGP
ncbi:MAG TPA: prephenate dehydrogenase/arogenate dehydrogenase family protein [Acidimicrobiales bacterium]|nr:prephenate dehydrogenase/arogenate dehydrogenase family protein [Acidimicrobiales bacterium]